VLRRFDVPETVAFFRELGVDLKREDTGKLFPTSDDAHTVLDALLNAARDARVRLLHPYRVEGLARSDAGFTLSGSWGSISAGRVILATGGRSLPKSGSDGGGYALAQSLGHTLTPRIFPALVPLILPGDHWLRDLSGIAADVRLSVKQQSGKTLVTMEGALLCTHFGVSGPAALDISRYFTDAHADDPAAAITVNWLPDRTAETAEAELLSGGRATILKLFAGRIPERLLRTICASVAVEPGTACDQLPRDKRRALARALTDMPLPIVGDRGYTYAEVTAGGVPLSELRLETMESRLCPGLYLCGEICDVDGRIGGYNFQWAWASGYIAGISAAKTQP
jgi:predicted Rossmann fold flavoprotein